jgi:hypothetical protein
MQNETNKRTPVRFVAAPSTSSKPTKITTTSVARGDSKDSVVCVIGDSSATSVINTLLDS